MIFTSSTPRMVQLISCTILGVLLVKIIESSKALNKIFAEA